MAGSSISATPLRLILADDHVLFREGLRSLLEAWEQVEVVGEASNGEEAVDMAHRLRPDVVLMDVGMPRMNGLEAARRITREIPGVKVLMLTIHSTDEHFFEALAAGASGYVLKEAASAELKAALEAIRRGGLFLHPSMALRLVEDYLHRVSSGEEEATYETLTQREKEVLRLVGEGYSSQEIAERLVLSSNTVQTHRMHIMEKLNLHSRAELMRYAVRMGLLPGNRA
ncbi:MAG: response regulator transcription factor [Dehalococcoidia bacterium]|nr:response regulator transcription factor [Dehalococcoidia bacterium]